MPAPMLLHLAVLSLFHYLAAGHGYMAKPKSRNLLYGAEGCPHCLNAGGPGLVVGDGARYPNGRWGICGDPATGPLKHEAGGMYAREQIVARYAEGQAVELESVITAFHKGSFEYRICVIKNYDPKNPANEQAQLTEGCLEEHVLLQAKVAEAQAPGDRWFHLGQENTGIPCPERVCVLGGTIHTSYHQLPPGLVCDGVSAKCVLQWHWVSGNSCNPPGEPAQYSSPSLPDCATDSWAYPEEFWNCADIAIMPAGTPVDPIPDVTPDPIPGESPKPVPSMPTFPSRPPPCNSADKMCICSWMGGTGFYPELATKCRRYYVCGGPTPLYKACPESPRLPGTRMRFSMKTMSCHDPKDVSCPKTFAGILDLMRNTDCRPADNPRACDFCSKVVPYVEGNYADAQGDCSGFFICTKTVNQYVACAPGLKFNTAGGYCDWPGNVQCSPVIQAANTTLPHELAAKGVKAPKKLAERGIKVPSKPRTVSPSPAAAPAPAPAAAPAESPAAGNGTVAAGPAAGESAAVESTAAGKNNTGGVAGGRKAMA